MSTADQGFAVGGMFLANIALARTQSKAEYGIFALTYSVFTFLSGLHNAAILEAYTIYGSGRYGDEFPQYSRLLWRANVILTAGLAAALTIGWAVFLRLGSSLASPTVLGLALACGALLSSAFIRRTFYVRRRPDLAAAFSTAYFLTFAFLLWISSRTGLLNGFYVFVMAAVSWCIAALCVARELPGIPSGRAFLEGEPGYWLEHWRYSRWVFVTALVFLLTTQAYYWLAAGILSVKDVANLRAMYNLILPIDQVSAAVTLLVLPVLSFRYASSGTAGVFSLWRVYCLGWFVVTAFFAAAVNLVGKPIMHVLYGGRFDDVTTLIGTLGFLPVVMAIGNTLNATLKAMEKPQAVFYAYLASGAVTLVLGMPLMVHFGLSGAVYGLLGSGGAYTAALAISFFRLSRPGRRRDELVSDVQEEMLARL